MSESSSRKAYYTPLPGVFAGLLQRAINSQLANDPEALNMIKSLGARVLGLDLEGTGLELFFHSDNNELIVTAEKPSEVATWIRGTPIALFGMAKPELAKPEWANPESKVTIEGDASLVRDFETLMKKLDFDWEDKLSNIVGDVLAHQLGLAAKGIGGFAQKVAEFGRDVGQSGLQGMAAKQAKNFTSRTEFGDFRESVESLGDAVTEIEKKIKERTGNP